MTPHDAGESLDALVARRLRAPLAALRMRFRLYQSLDGVVRIVFVLLTAAVVQFVLDRWLRFSLDQRALLNLLITSGALVAGYRWLVGPLLAPVTDRWLAGVVDRAHPRLAHQLATAVQFVAAAPPDARGQSPQLVAAAVRDACRAAAGVRFESILDHRRAFRHCAIVVALLGAAGLGWVLDPHGVGIWFRRNWLVQEVPWPQQTRIALTGFDADGRRRVPLGEELEIVALIEGVVPSRATLTWSGPGGRSGREAMTRVGRRQFEASLGTLTGDVRLRVSAGDDRTREHVVEAVERPSIVRAVTRVTPPTYTEVQPIEYEQPGALDVLAGSEIVIDVWLNKPVAEARFVGAGPAAVGETTRPGSDRVRVRWTEPASGTYTFELTDFDGWDDPRPLRFTFRVLPDAPPTAALRVTGASEVVTPAAVLALELTCKDAYGLGRVSLYAQREADPPLEVSLAGVPRGVRQHRAEARLEVAALSAAPGERVRIWGEAADLDPRGPNVGTAPAIELRVLAPDEFLHEMARRELELRREFELLVSAQRALKDALERLAAERPDAPAPVSAAQRLAALARRQETHAARAADVAARFERILDEMIASRVARPDDERRILGRIVTPLVELARDRMPAAAAEMNAQRVRGSAARLEHVVAEQEDILRRMRSILAHMLVWEGFREAVTLLEQIITEQRELHDATVEEMAREIESLLETLERPPPDSAPTPFER